MLTGETSAPHDQYVVGVDVGEYSGTAVVVRVRDGVELGSAELATPDGGDPTEADRWLTVLQSAVPDSVAHAGVNPAWVVGVGVTAGTARAAEWIVEQLAGGGDAIGGLTGKAAEWTGLPEGIAVAPGSSEVAATAVAAGAFAEERLLIVLEPARIRLVVSGPTGSQTERPGPGDPGGAEPALAEPVGAHGLVALVEPGEGSGVVVGSSPATTPEQLARARLEAVVFDLRAHVDDLARDGVAVTEVVLAGGLRDRAELPRIVRDVLRLPVTVLTSDRVAALGAAVHAAVAAGSHPDPASAAETMGAPRGETLRPDEADADVYDELYAEYRLLHDHFGRGGNDVLHRLAALRREVLGS